MFVTLICLKSKVFVAVEMTLKSKYLDDCDRTKLKANEQRLENGFIRFIDHANMVIDTTIMFLGAVVRELWTIFELGIMADCYIMHASVNQ